jgi:Lar family restriction alleviation protein
MTDLLPCPFCGGTAERIEIEEHGDNFGGTCIGCQRCGASGPVHFDRKENLVSSWNDRTPLHSRAARDVLDERARQIDEEGWTPEHDDRHAAGTLACAAACYSFAAFHDSYFRDDGSPVGWPWARQWWKPTNARRDLVKAGALILAEIERLDRAVAKRGRE